MSYELDCMLTIFFLNKISDIIINVEIVITKCEYSIEDWYCSKTACQTWNLHRSCWLIVSWGPKFWQIYGPIFDDSYSLSHTVWFKSFYYFRFLFDEEEDEEGLRKKSRRRKMREKISMELADVAASYGLVRFQPLVVTDERLIRNVILQVKRN